MQPDLSQINDNIQCINKSYNYRLLLLLLLQGGSTTKKNQSTLSKVMYKTTGTHFWLRVRVACVLDHPVLLLLLLPTASFYIPCGADYKWPDSTELKIGHFRNVILANLLVSTEQVLSSSGDGRPFGHNRQGPKIGGGLWLPLLGGSGSPSNTVWSGPRPTFIPSGILIHPAIRSQQIWAENWGLCPFGGSWVLI